MFKVKLKINENSITFYSNSSLNEGYFEEMAKKHNLTYTLSEKETGTTIHKTQSTIYICKLTKKMINSKFDDLYLALIEITKDMRHEYGDDGNTTSIEFV